MRPPSGRLVVGLGVVLCLIMLIFTVSNGGQQKSAQSAPRIPTLTPTPTPKDSKARAKQKPKKTAVAKQNTLSAAVAKLASAYYHISYTDTDTVHRAYLRRHGPAFARGLLDGLYFGLDEKGSAFNQDRRENHLSMRGTAQLKKLSDRPNGGVTKRLVTVPVLVRAIRSDGNEKYHFVAPIRTTWQKRGGAWTLLSFTEYQQGSDGE